MEHRPIPKLTEKEIARFWAKVDIRGFDDCWEWTRCSDRDGYGQIRIQCKLYCANRIAYYLHYNNDPGKLCVCHICDNPKCVNPSHLWLGTYNDNNRDCITKGRQPNRKGSKHPSAKLTESQVLNIRKQFVKGVSQNTLSCQYMVHQSTISNILRRRFWKHI